MYQLKRAKWWALKDHGSGEYKFMWLKLSSKSYWQKMLKGRRLLTWRILKWDQSLLRCRRNLGEKNKKRQLASWKSNQTKSQLNTPQKKLLKNATCSVQRKKKRTGTSNIEIWFKLLQKGQSIVNIIVTFQFTKLQF